MGYFQKIAQANVQPLIAALARQPELWDKNDLRTTHEGSAHKDASDIWLRFTDINSAIPSIDDLDNIDYPALSFLHQARTLIFDLMHLVEGNRLGRCIITKLPVGGKILPHIDEGKSPKYYDRYHIVLQNYLGSIFRVGNDTICANSGDVYWFNNKVEHEVINDSIDERIVMIIDIHSK